MHDLFGRGTVDELIDHIVAFTIHGGEEVNQDTQYDGTQKELITLLLNLSEDTLQPVHRTSEVETHQTAGDTQKDAAWDDVDAESLVEIELKQGGSSVEGVGYAHGGDAGDHQW